MRRSLAVPLVLIAMALTAAVASRRNSSRPAKAGSASPAEPRQGTSNAFATRHALEEQYAPTIQADTVIRVYGLKNRLLHTRLRLILTEVGHDRVIRAELGFAPSLLIGSNAPAMRALLSDLLHTFVPRADSAQVAPLRAEIERMTVQSAATKPDTAPPNTTTQRAQASAAYLTLLTKRDSIAVRYSESQLWIDNGYLAAQHLIDSKPAWYDSATVVQITLKGVARTQLLYTDWQQRPEVLGGTVDVLERCLGRAEIDTKHAVRIGYTIVYPELTAAGEFQVSAQLDQNDAVRELTFREQRTSRVTPDSVRNKSYEFLDIARRTVPDLDQYYVFRLTMSRGPQGIQSVETPAWRHITDALYGTRGPVVINFSISSLRFDRMNDTSPRMTLALRGSFGAATDSVPK